MICGWIMPGSSWVQVLQKFETEYSRDWQGDQVRQPRISVIGWLNRIRLRADWHHGARPREWNQLCLTKQPSYRDTNCHRTLPFGHVRTHQGEGATATDATEQRPKADNKTEGIKKKNDATGRWQIREEGPEELCEGGIWGRLRKPVAAFDEHMRIWKDFNREERKQMKKSENVTWRKRESL